MSTLAFAEDTFPHAIMQSLQAGAVEVVETYAKAIDKLAFKSCCRINSVPSRLDHMKKAMMPLLLILAAIIVLAGVAYYGETKGWDHLFGSDGHEGHGH